ncbi:hypothetical protein GE061_006922 [Apolygus lucorum]|uniref:IC97/Casc1 N-terminal domain-containing protein n=1 Tax=Apolygus lucorum TaxID=248454 RepID=A0A8S9WRS7_APOLU|nr:hypothetical protein GE061_006922 [Apolygus lucorum]
MPPKKDKKSKRVKPRESSRTSNADSRGTISENASLDAKDRKKEKTKPLTRKEREHMKKQEKVLKERIIQLRKEADQLLADLKATEEAAHKKAENEANEQAKRINVLTSIIENFKFAKSRLLHEHNKRREKEIWERYLDTNQMPYPDNNPNMHTHLYLWNASKIFEDIEVALPKCDSYIGVFSILDDLIEHPIYASKETLNNWKETRDQWRAQIFNKLDKACFNMIKDLEANFEKEVGDQETIFSYEDWTDHIQIGIIAWVQHDESSAVLRVSPKFNFPSLNVHIVMPAAYRRDSFIFRIIYLDQDFLSDSSLTFYCPEGLLMESDMLDEVRRCFESKADAKASVADREREKVRVAKQKVIEAQTAAQLAERSFENLQMKTKKSQNTVEETPEQVEEVKEPAKKKKVREFAINLDTGSEMNVGSIYGGKRPKGIFSDTDGPKSIMQSEGNQRALDAISMRSGMRKKVQERMKKLSKTSDEEVCTNVFYTRSMISLAHRQRKVEVRKDSELCIEQPEDTESNKSEESEEESEASFDSLELMFGRNEEDETVIKSVKTLVRNTTILARDGKQRPQSKSVMSSSTVRSARKRGRSIASMKKLTEESDDLQQTASEIFEVKEDLRQEKYMASLIIQDIQDKRNLVNLRAFFTIGGVYYLDVIIHESQPKPLKDEKTVQIFFGEHNIKRYNYKYDYTPPPVAPDDPDIPPPLDPGLQHLLHIKVPLPKNILFSGCQPIVALWDRESKCWSRQHVHHFELDFTTNTATFEVGRIWPFAFLLEKFSLLPYTKWILKPKFEIGGVSLMIQTQSMNFEFLVKNSSVCLNSVEGILTKSVIEDFVGVLMPVNELVRIMKSRGLNLFPDNDSFLYVVDNTAKDVVLEDHTCMTLAMFSDSLEFQSCQWNYECKRRKLAFLVRECLAYNLELRLRTVTATALSAFLYRCNDEDGSLDESKLDNLGFCPDVYSLLEKAFAHATPASALNPLQVITVYSLLARTKVLSYCGFYRKDTTSSSSDTSKKSPKRKGKKTGGKVQRKIAKAATGSRSSQVTISLMTESMEILSIK